MSRVKSMREEKNQKKLLQEYNKRKELAKLRDKHSPEFSNWRGNVAEGMNTGNVFFTTLPATGDTDLETISTEVSSSFEDAGGNDAFENTTVRGSGTGSGSDGGFNIGNHLAFQGDGQPRWAILKPIDSSKFDTLTISAIRGNDTNGGEDPDATGEELRLYYLPPGGSAFRSIGVNPEGQTVQPADFDVIIPLGSDNSGLRDYEIKLPSYARGAAFRYMLYQLTNSGTGFDNYGIKNVRYQRKAPLSVFVPLDSPEAASFINDGSGGLSPEEKKKRLEDMLAASDEYQSRQFPFNKAAYEQAAKDVARNIQISLDPSTFDVPTYGSPTYNQMFNARIEPGVGDTEIENALEREGLTLDTLEKGVVKNKGQFKMGREATLTLINNPYTQEKALTALGIDMSLVNNFTPDSYEKITKITNLRPGGTPATGWDGKFYSYEDPNLERSRIIPLETYLQVKGTDNFYGFEKPDTVEPGHRYVMEKKYSFSTESTPNYVGVRNKDINDKITNDMKTKAYSGSNQYVGGVMWDYRIYKNGIQNLKSGNKFSLAYAADSAANAINYQYRIADLLAFEYLYDARRFSGIYTDRVEQIKDRDLSTEYNPLYLWSEDPEYAEMLDTMRGLTSGRQLDMPVSYYTSNIQSAESKASEEKYHKAKNDRIVADLQAAFEKIDSINNIYAFEKDEWYLKNDDQSRFVSGIQKVHPYSGLPEPETTPEEPTPEEPTPEEPYINIKVGDEQIIKQGNEIVLDTLKGIDNRQKNSIEKEMDKVQKMPPAVKKELARLLNLTGTSEYTPTPPKTKKEIEDYWASLPPEKISDIEGRTQASGVDAIGLGIAALAGLALGASGAGAALTSAVSSGISKIKNLTKAKPTPSKVKYPSNMRTPGSPGKPTSKGADFGKRMRQQVAQDYGTSTSQQGGKIIRTRPNTGYNPGGNTSLLNSYEPQGDSLMDNYEPKAKHNEKINNHPKIKSPKEFFKKADIKPVYPDTPPPEMINGRHPDLVDDTKIAKRFTKLDPESAKAMPNTGSPQIDALVRAARKKPK